MIKELKRQKKSTVEPVIKMKKLVIQNSSTISSLKNKGRKPVVTKSHSLKNRITTDIVLMLYIIADHW